MLYVGKQGAVSYEAIGNIELGAGSKGSVALWYHPSAEQQRSVVFMATADEGNGLMLTRSQETWVWNAISGGAGTTVTEVSADVAWRFVVATWDFSAGPGSGVIRLYLDGEEVANSPATTATAPLGPPDMLQVGPGVENVYALSHAVFDQMAIWDDAMSAQQVAALHALSRRHVPAEADGAGALLFRASWDGRYDAEVAEGSPTASFAGAADQYCRLDLASRHRGKRFSYRIGMPRHDGSEGDRVPAMAVLKRTKWGALTETNADEYGQLEVDGSNTGHPVGASLAPWLPSPTAPMTLRVGLHLPAGTVPWSLPVGVGAHSYYIGGRRRFECAAGCTTQTLKSATLVDEDDHWAGAELMVLSGGARNEKLKVVGNSQSGTSVTVQGALSQAPAAGDVAVVSMPKRVEPFQAEGNLHRLECDLSEVWDGDRFTTLETAICGVWGYTCVNLGRVQLYPYTLTHADVFFGKRDYDLYSEWTCTILIERIEMDGPGTYAVTEGTDDTFLVCDPDTGESIRVAQLEGLERETRQPEQYATPADIQESFKAAGTWRESVLYCPSWMEYEADTGLVRALLVGVDGVGVERIGYVLGEWDEEQGHVVWEDDPDPRNPMFALDELRAVLAGRSRLYNVLGMMNAVFEVDEGEWALVFTATVGNPDGMLACALTGAPDRYSFDPAAHFDESLNPLTPAMAGEDKLVAEGGGIPAVANRDLEPRFVRNPWARHRSERFWGYARAKTINNIGDEVDYYLGRPLSCLVTGDFRHLRTLPWRNQVITPTYGWFHWPHPEWFGPSTVGLVVDDGGVTNSNVSLYVSEDGVHLWPGLGKALIPRDTPPLNGNYLMPLSVPVRAGDKRVYWYRSGKVGNDFNIATIRLDGEALYRLADGALTGELLTCGLKRRGATWEELRVNADPRGGAVRVAVLDAETGDVVPGFGEGDCDAVPDDVSRRITWDGAGLSEVALEEIALRFTLTRPGAGDASPELYAWTIAQPPAGDEPSVQAVQVEGKVNPARVADPRPDLSWEYEDPQDRAQTAYHVLVASTEAKLDAHEGDLWDSGVVLSAEPKAKYEGDELGSEQTYFWKVRVRNSEGVWSEAW